MVEPIGAEMTALKIVASTADASRTRPVLFRTNRRPVLLSVVTATPTLLVSHRYSAFVVSETPWSHECQGITKRDAVRVARGSSRHGTA